MPRKSFKAAAPSNYEPVPAAKYRVRIDDAKWEPSKSGNQQLWLLMCILDKGAYEERRVSEWITSNENTGWKFAQLAEAALDPSEYDKVETGELDSKGRPTYDYEFDTDDLPGSEMMVQATIEEDNKGAMRNRFRFIPRAQEEEGEEASKDAVDEITKASGETQTSEKAEETPAVTVSAPATETTRRRRMQA